MIQKENLTEKFDLIVIDECHKLGAESFGNVLTVFSSARYVFGLSATPDRPDEKHMIYFSYFDKQV